MKSLSLAAALALLFASSARADIVFLNSGEELTGSVVRVDSSTVILNASGHETSYPLSRVLKVKLVRVFGVPGETVATDIADSTLKAALKSPAGPSDYPDDGYLTYLDNESCEIGENRRVLFQDHIVRLVLRERDKENAANVTLPYIEGQSTTAIDWARAINGNKISNLDDTSIEEGSEYTQMPDYDRLKSIKFAIPDVATGTIVDYSKRLETTVDAATQPYIAVQYFQHFEPAALIRFTLTTPKDVPFNAVAVGLPQNVQTRIEDMGSRLRRTWEVQNVTSFKSEDAMPPYPRIAPFVEAAPVSTWPEVAAAAAAAIVPRLDPGPALSTQVAQILQEKTNDAAKVEALYNWVAREITYQPVSMGDYSYAPKSPAEIFAHKTGNMLDKPFLLFVMLRQAGFKPQLAYLEDKGGMPFQNFMPSLGQFSAAAVLLDFDGKRLTLTPLEDTRRWQETPDWLQGVHGLVVFGSEQGRIFETPLTSAERESETHLFKLALSSDGSLSGSETILPLGQDQIPWRQMKDWKKQDIEHRFEDLVHGIHPNARLLDYSVEGLNDPTRDLAIHVSFVIKDYALLASGGYMALRLPEAGYSADDVGKPSREEPMFFWTRWSQKRQMSVSLPKGYRLYYAPPAVRLDGPGQSYEAAYTNDGRGTLDYSENFTRDTVEISTAQYASYKTFREVVANSSQKWIVLKKQP